MPIVITSGDPAGIGPDIILQTAAQYELAAVVLGDFDVLNQRARQLKLDLSLIEYRGQSLPSKKGSLFVQHLTCPKKVCVGQDNPDNAEYVLAQLDAAVAGCLTHNYSAMVTAPINKAMVCQAGYEFSGHTDYIAELTQTKNVVMMLACEKMRVALVTTHLPLADVPAAITPLKVEQTIITVKAALQNQFGLASPRLMVAGLNPHAGEGGYMGTEEIDVITPVLARFDSRQVIGPVAADTMFSVENCQTVDAFIAMYHDQGLAVLKYAGFGNAANISLGLPIIRTSVDHGTAYNIAGTGKASTGSLRYALSQAVYMAGVDEKVRT